MTSLINNLGTSDLLIEIDGYYLPVGFNRDEKNTDFSGISEAEHQQWKSRQKTIATTLCQELGVEVASADSRYPYSYSFRELTQKILAELQRNPDLWSKRLRLGRINGIIERAQAEFAVSKAYIFVTDHSTDTNPNGHFGDTCYLFEILNALAEENLTLIPIAIEGSAVDADGLLEEYYNFFARNIPKNEAVLVSIKGGTPQMQTALKMQAVASGIPDLLFIDPQLNVAKIMNGNKSECKITSYWRYVRSQKYQTVKLLLDSRWDFQGAKVILEEWQTTLRFLQQHIQPEDAKELEGEERKLESIISQLNKAVDYLNFASAEKNRHKLHSVLNLYTQCRIYWSLEEVANFLPRLGTFYEETIQAIIVELGGEKYFEYGNRNSKWNLLRDNLDSDLIEKCKQAERKFIWDSNLWKPITKIKDDASEQIIEDRLKWYKKNSRLSRILKGRYRKRSFAEALINYSGDQDKIYFWKKIDDSLSQIDYWVDQRNDLIHGVKGLSISSMVQNHQQDKLDYQNSSSEEQENPYNCDPNQSCDAEEIIDRMSIICHNTLKLFGQSKSDYIDLKNPQQAKYYLYSEIREQVIKDLMDY
ncbi:MAG: hypothetical protein AAFQ14_10785 [Cyanobacteria bacterium J06621_12]